jgi:hypothetical protein
MWWVDDVDQKQTNLGSRMAITVQCAHRPIQIDLRFGRLAVKPPSVQNRGKCTRQRSYVLDLRLQIGTRPLTRKPEPPMLDALGLEPSVADLCTKPIARNPGTKPRKSPRHVLFVFESRPKSSDLLSNAEVQAGLQGRRELWRLPVMVGTLSNHRNIPQFGETPCE